MKNLKKIIVCSIAFTCLFSTGMSTFAAEGKTDVSYDNSHQIVDPTDPTWAVRIPSEIVIEMDETFSPIYNVELVNKSGTTTWPFINMSIKSQNAYRLQLDGIKEIDDMDYAMLFINHENTNINYGYFDKRSGYDYNYITQLNETRKIIDGAASRLVTPHKKGLHTDVVTFKAERVNQISY